MNLQKLKETLRKQCQINHETVIAIQTLRNFNIEYNIIEMMKPPKNEASERRMQLIKKD